MKAITSSNELLYERLPCEDDGLRCRPIQAWTLEKLAILLQYLQAFTSACKSAHEVYYIDGMCGPGQNQVTDSLTPVVVKGSPLVALDAQPAFTRCLLMDQGRDNAAALTARIARYGDRAVFQQGDVNADFVPFVQRHVPSWAPVFCLLDPEGTELHWTTVAGIAQLPGRKRKPELLILFPTNLGFHRNLRLDGELNPLVKQRFNRYFPTAAWYDVYQQRIHGERDPTNAALQYMDLYRQGLKALGYGYVGHRSIHDPASFGGKAEIKYHLIFATDHPAGERIMRAVFGRPYALDSLRHGQPYLPFL